MKKLSWSNALGRVGILALVAVVALAIAFYPLFKRVDDAQSVSELSAIRLDAAVAINRVDIAETIRGGNIDEALGMLEGQLYTDKDYLFRHLRHIDGELLTYVEGAIARIEEYQEQYPWNPSPIDEPRSRSGLGRSATYLPHFENGKQIGLRVSSINPSSFLAEIGLEEGDVIVAVDDQPMSNPDTMLRLTEVLADSQEFELMVMPASGTRRTIQYPKR